MVAVLTTPQSSNFHAAHGAVMCYGPTVLLSLLTGMQDWCGGRLCEDVDRLSPCWPRVAYNASVQLPIRHEVRIAYWPVCTVTIPVKCIAACASPLSVTKRLDAAKLGSSGHRDHKPRVGSRDAPRARDREHIAPGVKAVVVPSKARVLHGRRRHHHRESRQLAYAHALQEELRRERRHLRMIGADRRVLQSVDVSSACGQQKGLYPRRLRADDEDNLIAHVNVVDCH
eukprot:CAMPEP_0174702394 /NCGR_PEP_ID=MMETSP1094-20130205/6694_1 /TAXON_ID=156173 /ORGANISM="Chrysochromulina brevifilum, Strain UTEX LB 985" /LENGTH=227 /DNA_ID=CAMNT_0015900165 /DNA_START=96 /DNA_END=776 /DNA_ORIENTATION=-